MKTFNLELTESEAKDLLRLIDVAAKAQGILVASAVDYFHKKLQASYENSLKNGTPKELPQ